MKPLGTVCCLLLICRVVLAAQSDRPDLLRERVREADWILLARVESVSVAYTLPEKIWYDAACRPVEVLKGNDPGKEVKIRFRLPRESEEKILEAGKSYWLFPRGDSVYNLELAHPRVDAVERKDPVAMADVGEMTEDAFRTRVVHAVAEGPRFRRVEIHVRTEGGWMADFHVYATGRVKGSHVSGGEHPFEHIEEGRIKDAEVLEAFQTLAATVYASDVPSEPVIRTNDLVYIQITPYRGPSKVYQRPRQGSFDDPDLKALDALLHKHRIGAW